MESLRDQNIVLRDPFEQVLLISTLTSAQVPYEIAITNNLCKVLFQAII